MASKTVYGEALPVFMRGKRFKFRDLYSTATCLDAMGSFQRQYIANAYFGFLGDHALKAFQLLQGCIRLRHLVIDISAYEGPQLHRLKDHGQLNECVGLKTLLQIRGLRTLEVVFDKAGHHGSVIDYKDTDSFLKTLQILKEPFDAQSAAQAVLARRNAAGKGPRQDFLRPGIATRAQRNRSFQYLAADSLEAITTETCSASNELFSIDRGKNPDGAWYGWEKELTWRLYNRALPLNSTICK